MGGVRIGGTHAPWSIGPVSGFGFLSTLEMVTGSYVDGTIWEGTKIDVKKTGITGVEPLLHK